jgi:hypothetical protein
MRQFCSEKKRVTAPPAAAVARTTGARAPVPAGTVGRMFRVQPGKGGQHALLPGHQVLAPVCQVAFVLDLVLGGQAGHLARRE